MDHSAQVGLQWPLWRKIIFRFFFIYIALIISPWTWLDAIPGVSYVTQYYYQVMDWAVRKANAKFFHVRKVLIEPNGSGDTSWAWAQTWLLLILALIGCIVWSILDRKRPNYFHLNYWLCLFTRYYIAMVAFTYGIIKLFALQMFFPNLSQLATPLGDFLPMRLSWMFIGYSTPYQVFSGVMETIVGLLLLYRRTATLGILMGTAVFLNVMMLNLAYDIPVKLYSIQITLLCVFLLVNEWDRVFCFFILNRQAPACTIYYYPFTKKWMKVSRIILKTVFIIIATGLQFYNTNNYYKQVFAPNEKQPVKQGVYTVETFVVNKDTIPVSMADTVRWQDVIFDKGSLGSIKTSDTSFRQRYRRAYFYYSFDSTASHIDFKKFQGDSVSIATFRFEQPDSNTVFLKGKLRNDSLYVSLKRINRHFQLAEKQFHWLSEANR